MKKKYCYLIVLLILNLSNAQIAFPVPDFEVCDDLSNDGVETFDLSIFDTTVLGNQNPNNFTVSYHLSQAGAISNTDVITNPNSFVNSTNPQTIYTRVTSSTGGWDQHLFDLIISYAPVGVSLTPFEVCDSNLDGFEVFDLSTKDVEIVNGQTTGVQNISISYHSNLTDASNNTNALTQLYSNITPNNQTIFVRVENSSSPVCFDVSSLELVALDCTDSDNDGVIDIREDVNSNGLLTDDDTDMDSIPNYLDTDDDGDGVLTIDEDYNNNGDPTDDDTDNSGIADYLEINVFLSLESQESTVFKMYPNPSKGLVYIESIIPVLKVSIYDVKGKKLNIKALQNSSTLVMFNTEKIKKGIYFVIIVGENGSTAKKLVVRN
ncbi:putative secreted protein (Por secretion system target) [Nonlabens dokdonensis]|jgi:hypothetical protein|uniref:Secretion system C-terminal sorting domain-containing protein n=2 Tax=Nonlabens dokdonensis TaxID=328515 RepID=L7WGZ3_NONDD|nr:T9SS type A sorting domain-containing protein [Nonlabens dokdonensis]AGC78223.1 hypothetical protein DDD_3096 [Nonlabens dokdonensis DSW-6]PZX37886.1 putative secreted protein (Por secretion system target) [Nonlabens dokdonensis]